MGAETTAQWALRTAVPSVVFSINLPKLPALTVGPFVLVLFVLLCFLNHRSITMLKTLIDSTCFKCSQITSAFIISDQYEHIINRSTILKYPCVPFSI